MNKDFSSRENIPKVDPYKWKPLFGIILSGLIVIPLFFVEALILPDVLAGHKRYLIQACIYGALLVVLLHANAVGLWRWWHRPIGEAVIMQAAAQVAQILPDAPRVFRPRQQPPPNKAIYAALPLTCLGLSIGGMVIGNWVMCLAFFGLAIFFAGLFWYVFVEAQKTRELVLAFDPTRKTVVFENFSFATTFLPQKPRLREEIPFEQILDCTFYPGHNGGPPTLRVRTSQGPTVISGEMENFDAIRALLENLVTLNLADPEQHQVSLRSEPKVKIPWFGWLILAGVFSGLGILIWFLLTKL